MALSESSLWLRGPDWLHSTDGLLDPPEVPMETTIPEDCQCEMKRESLTLSLIAVGETGKPRLSQIIDPEKYSSSHHLFRVTALVLKFVSCLRERVSHKGPLPQSSVLLTRSDLSEARL